jgi:TatA/E family protein of Tat protein translocase
MELWIILIVVLIFFGNRIPGLARSLGSGISEFKSGLKEGEKPKADDDKNEPSDKTA